MGANCGCFEGVAGGALPPARPKEVTLKYFPIAGRAEVIRLALVLGGIKFNDVRLTSSEWESTEKQNAPFGQLPVLIVDGEPIAQTKAILRYIGKLSSVNGTTCLYPQDPLLAAKVDEVMDAFDDLWILISPTYRIQDQQQKEQARKRLFADDGEASIRVNMFERILSNSTNGYVVPQAGLTVADLMYFSFLNVIRSGFVEGLDSHLLDGYTAIMKHKEKIANIAEISAYYRSEAANPMRVPHYEVFKVGQ
eukprot:gb/GFBE01017139.1/.p1 GENE.gb/GFBE01017139.1/~~gb/GFBE01017139.1/.p1  ORF type:complete len:251 (+),score=66.57 gb/GFBE01017139.1/:1-753(+)